MHSSPQTRTRDLARISDPLIAVAAGIALGNTPRAPLTSQAIHKAVGEIQLSTLSGSELAGSVRAWIASGPEARRRHVVRQTGLSWETGTPADFYARSLTGIHGNAASAFQVLQTEVLSGRAPEDQAWWTLVEAELHTLMGLRN